MGTMAYLHNHHSAMLSINSTGIIVILTMLGAAELAKDDVHAHVQDHFTPTSSQIASIHGLHSYFWFVIFWRRPFMGRVGAVGRLIVNMLGTAGKTDGRSSTSRGRRADLTRKRSSS